MQATLGSRNSDSDAAAGGGCSTPGSESCPWPSYSMTDANGVVHKCTVRLADAAAVALASFLHLDQYTRTEYSFFSSPSPLPASVDAR